MMISLLSKAADDGRTLTSLWKQYYEASKADRPQKEAEILQKIREEALVKRLPVDFYDAGKEYVSVVERRDWKKSSQLRLEFGELVKKFDYPIVTYTWMKEFGGSSADARLEFVRSRLSDFRDRHPQFYRDIDYQMGGNLKDFIQDDREYVLWDLLVNRYYYNEEDSEVYRELNKLLGKRYPNAAYLEYYIICRKNKSVGTPLLEGFVEKYKGRGISFWARQVLIMNEFDQLKPDKNPDSDYRAIYEKCKLFEKERKALRGTEAKVAEGCERPKDLMEQLTGKSLGVSVRNEKIEVTMQNLETADVSLSQGKNTLHKWVATDSRKSFYLSDTVRLALPKLADGTYIIRAKKGKLEDYCEFEQYTLSLATRQDKEGLSVYVADYKSGEPLTSAKFSLIRSGKEIASTVMKLGPGFTLLPEAFQMQFSTGRYFDIVASSGERKSKESSLYRESWSEDNTVLDGTYCNIYKDRGAYNPGDEVKFKAVVCRGNLVDKIAVVKDLPLSAVLINAQNKEIGRIELKTNEFGSVSGSFALPKDQRNGRFTLKILSEGRTLKSDTFQVDEFILPTYTLEFEKLEKLCLPREEVTVRGKLKSYSGHSLVGARLETIVERYGHRVYEASLSPEKDGGFEVKFIPTDSGYHNVQVTVVDATGETSEFNTGVYVANSINLSLYVHNSADADFDTETSPLRKGGRPYHYGPSGYIVTEGEAEVELTVRNSDGKKVPLPIQWTLSDEGGKMVSEGKVESGTTMRLSLPSPGLYTLKAVSTVEDKGIKDEEQIRILRIDTASKTLPCSLSKVLISGKLDVEQGSDIEFFAGASDGPLWAVATLYGKDRKPLGCKTIALDGKSRSLERIAFPYLEDYPDAVRLVLFYFRDGGAVVFEREFSRVRTRLTLPLKVTSFREAAFPGTQYSFVWQTDPGVEAVASVYDKSIDAIQPNVWNIVTLREFSVPYVGVNSVCGNVGMVIRHIMYKAAGRASSSAKGAAVAEEMVLMAEPMMERMAVNDTKASAAEAGAPDDVPVRENFEAALAFEPHLLSGKDGKIRLKFTTSDKLSTYYVALYAHDRSMRNALYKGEMVVSVPVKVSLVQPQFLYDGDSYEAAVTVSSNSAQTVKGQLYLYVYPTDTYKGVEAVSVQRIPLTVPAGGVKAASFTVKASGKAIGLKAVFAAEDFSDAVFVPIPVKPAVQSLTEAHSAVWRSGMDRDQLIKTLRKRFVNVPGSKAELKEISIIDMVREAIPSKIQPSGKDVLSLSEAWYVRKMAERIGKVEPEEEELLTKILACRNADGGFGWFEGMHSSAMITAVMLERFAKLRDRGVPVPDMARTVQWLDKYQFDIVKPLWCGWVTDAQYMYVRSLYSSVPFEIKPEIKEQRERMSDFKKHAKEYLVPSDERGLKGQILAKARRIKTLLQLSSSDEGIALAKKWGVTIAARTRLEKSLDADILSLVEYAVEHRDGGWYYPNAVMPWRGLLESEAYAHSMLCDLLTEVKHPEISDGIRIWLMLQKETQKWDEESAFVDALTSILDGSEDVLQTKVIALSATYSMPFPKIKASGNGFRISREFYRDGEVQEPVKPGDPVKVGEKIIVKYRIWNQENRSFVKLDAFREASLRPVDQLSGHIGWRFRPMYYGSWSFSPQGYRNVKSDRTEYFFDSYPEEDTIITEELFVTQSGSFTAPVVTIESLYAPHYRANDAFHGVLRSK